MQTLPFRAKRPQPSHAGTSGTINHRNPRTGWAFVASLLGALVMPDGAQAIIGGQEAPNMRPHLVMIVSDRGSLCSGVVIERRTILTAAHCVFGQGSYRLHWRDAQGQAVLAEPARITLHPDFHADAAKTRQRSIDLAVITSKEDLPASFVPAPLVQAKTEPPAKGMALTLAGYGLAQERDPNSAGVLKSVTLPVIMPYGQGRILVWLGNQKDGACSGDSGGGIFTAEGQLLAIMVWSEGQGKNLCGALTQGLLIAPQHAWITKQLERHRAKP